MNYYTSKVEKLEAKTSLSLTEKDQLKNWKQKVFENQEKLADFREKLEIEYPNSFQLKDNLPEFLC